MLDGVTVFFFILSFSLEKTVALQDEVSDPVPISSSQAGKCKK